MENDDGNWDSFRSIENKLPAHYDLGKFYPDRIKKPLTFEELQKLDHNAEQEPSELGRVHFKYFIKQRIAEIEKQAKISTKSLA